MDRIDEMESGVREAFGFDADVTTPEWTARLGSLTYSGEIRTKELLELLPAAMIGAARATDNDLLRKAVLELGNAANPLPKVKVALLDPPRARAVVRWLETIALPRSWTDRGWEVQDALAYWALRTGQPVVAPVTSRRFWKVDDPAWVRARAEEWERMRGVIDGLGGDMKSASCRAFFLKGDPVELRWGFRLGGVARVWFHPEPDETHWREALDEAVSVSRLRPEHLVDEVTSLVWSLRRPTAACTEYGVAGGLDARLARFLTEDWSGAITIASERHEHSTLRYGFEWWWRDASTWLTSPRSNPHWAGQDLVDGSARLTPEDPPRTELEIEPALRQCAHFVEPVGFAGEDSPRRRLVEQLRRVLERDELPPYAREVWERMRTRHGRSAWARAEPPKEHWEDDGFEVLTAHGGASPGALVATAIRVLRDLGFTSETFDPARAESLDLGPRLSRSTRAALGVGRNDAVPAYRYFVPTNADFTDADEARIHLDLIALPAPAGGKARGTRPSFFVVPRPERAYSMDGAQTYQLNVRLFARTFSRDAGAVLAPTVEHRLEPEDGPHHVAPQQPLTSGHDPILASTTDAFARLGESLPPLDPDAAAAPADAVSAPRTGSDATGPDGEIDLGDADRLEVHVELASTAARDRLLRALREPDAGDDDDDPFADVDRPAVARPVRAREIRVVWASLEDIDERLDALREARAKITYVRQVYDTESGYFVERGGKLARIHALGDDAAIDRELARMRDDRRLDRMIALREARPAAKKKKGKAAPAKKAAAKKPKRAAEKKTTAAKRKKR